MAKTILIVDDEKGIREVLGRFLLALDFKVIFAVNGIEGLKEVRHAKPDLVITDIEMPEMDGIALCEMIKKDPALKHIPVLFLTGDGRHGVAEHALAEGAGAFLTKPFDFPRIQDKIKLLLDT
ncbi:MAG: response regulator [Proteobacteria bacterium]|nr:response regulator [Pseudomonadota bacterium]